MKALLLIIGLPGTGKTSLAKKINNELNYSYISSDMIRANMLSIEKDNIDRDYTPLELETTYNSIYDLVKKYLIVNDGIIVEGVYRKKCIVI